MGKIFDFQFMIDSIPKILRGIPYTLLIAVVAFEVGLIIGLIGALCKIYKVPILRQITGVYVSFIRGTPLVVQFLLIYYGLPILLRAINPSINISWIPAVVFMLVAYSMSAGAYLTESIRAAIQAIDKTQIEAA